MIQFFHSDKLNPLREFMLSKQYMLFLLVVTCIFSALEWNVMGVLLLAVIIGVTLIVSKDIMPTFLPFMLLCLISAKCYNSFSIFIQYTYLGILLIGCLLFHFIVYRKPMDWRGELLLPMAVVSVVVLLGGVGFISAKEYFSPLSLFYMAALGFGMTFLYVLLKTHMTVKREYSLLYALTAVMVISGCFACFTLLMQYIIHLSKVLTTHEMLFMQYRNNYSTFLMLSIPFAFFLGHKKPYGIMLGFFFYFCILLTGSRGGLVFGAIEIMMCCILFILYDKKRRLTYICICLCLLFAVLIVMKDFPSAFTSTFDRLLQAINGVLNGEQQEVRYFQYQRGIQDFLKNPIFGTGIGYMGNRDVYQAADFAIGWYHCSVIQIPASFGVFGILAYLYLFVKRLIVLWKKPTMFNMTVFLSYISLELMSLVNPGIFSPVPYLLIATIFFAVVENCNGNEKQHKIHLRKSVKKGKSRKIFKTKKAEAVSENVQ